MNVLEVVKLLSWSLLITAMSMAFVAGAAPVFAVRLITWIYPKGHDRRVELLAEAAHVQHHFPLFELWRWIGENFATAACDGVPLRVRAARRRLLTTKVGRFVTGRRIRGTQTADIDVLYHSSHFDHTVSSGKIGDITLQWRERSQLKSYRLGPDGELEQVPNLQDDPSYRRVVTKSEQSPGGVSG